MRRPLNTALWILFALFLVYGTTIPFNFSSEPGWAAQKLAHIPLNPFIAADTGGRISIPDFVQNVLLFLVLLIALTVLEEFVVGWWHGHSAAQTLAAFGARSLLEIGATCLLVLLVLVPFIGVKELSRALGPGGLRRVLLDRSH